MHKLPWIRLLVGFIVFGLVLLQIGVSEATRVLSNANVALVVLVVALNLPILGLVTLRSAVLLRRLGHSPSFDILLTTSTVGYVVGALTPAASGELLRVQALHQRGGVSVKTSLTLVAFERMLSFYLLCLSTAMVATVTLLPWYKAVPLASLLALATFLPAFASSLLKLIPASPPDASGLRARASHFVRGAAEDVESLVHDRVALASASVMSVAIFGLVALQFWLLAEAVGASVELSVAWLSFGLSQIAGIASMLPFGVGVSDGSLTAVLGGFNVGTETGVAVALLVRVAVTLPLIVVAALAHLYLVFPRTTVRTSGPLTVEKL
jgi:uncharacterized protein (TIRG00374 family)